MQTPFQHREPQRTTLTEMQDQQAGCSQGKCFKQLTTTPKHYNKKNFHILKLAFTKVQKLCLLFHQIVTNKSN